MPPAWYRYDAAARRLTLVLHVQPGARRTEIAGEHGGALKVRVAAPAAENRANAALVAFLSEVLGVPQAAIALERGASARRKLVTICPAPPALLERLGPRPGRLT